MRWLAQPDGRLPNAMLAVATNGASKFPDAAAHANTARHPWPPARREAAYEIEALQASLKPMTGEDVFHDLKGVNRV